MPIYTFKCPNPHCNSEYTFKWSFTEHTQNKNNVECEKCFTKLVQKVESSNFVLKGYGWYKPNDLTQGIDPYAISDSEIAKNKDEAKRADDTIQNMSAKQMESD